MLLKDVLHDTMVCEVVYTDDKGNILTEAAIRAFKRIGRTLTKKFRCLAGPKAGKLVTKPSSCGTRKDPKKIRIGRKAARTKKGIRILKTRLAKRTSMSKLVKKMNLRLRGDS